MTEHLTECGLYLFRYLRQLQVEACYEGQFPLEVRPPTCLMLRWLGGWVMHQRGLGAWVLGCLGAHPTSSLGGAGGHSLARWGGRDGGPSIQG